jgi:hypothetical protein
MLPSLAAADQPLLILVVAFLYSVEDEYSVGKQTAGNCGAIWQSGNLAMASLRDWQGVRLLDCPPRPLTQWRH